MSHPHASDDSLACSSTPLSVSSPTHASSSQSLHSCFKIAANAVTQLFRSARVHEKEMYREGAYDVLQAITAYVDEHTFLSDRGPAVHAEDLREFLNDCLCRQLPTSSLSANLMSPILDTHALSEGGLASASILSSPSSSMQGLDSSTSLRNLSRSAHFGGNQGFIPSTIPQRNDETSHEYPDGMLHQRCVPFRDSFPLSSERGSHSITEHRYESQDNSALGMEKDTGVFHLTSPVHEKRASRKRIPFSSPKRMIDEAMSFSAAVSNSVPHTVWSPNNPSTAARSSSSSHVHKQVKFSFSNASASSSSLHGQNIRPFLSPQRTSDPSHVHRHVKDKMILDESTMDSSMDQLALQPPAKRQHSFEPGNAYFFS